MLRKAFGSVCLVLLKPLLIYLTYLYLILKCTCLNIIIKSKFFIPQFSCWDSSISFGNWRIVIVISGIVIVFDCALCTTSTPICVIYLYLYIFTGRRASVCVCCVRYVSSHVGPFVAWKLTIGLVRSSLRFPYVLPACLLFFCLSACLPYSLQDLLLFFGEAYKSKIFCNLPSKGNCGQICLSTCDISNVRARVARKGCPVQN